MSVVACVKSEKQAGVRDMIGVGTHNIEHGRAEPAVAHVAYAPYFPDHSDFLR